LTTIKEEINEIVNRETEAWNQKDVEKLLSIFHQDMVWPWPETSKDHDPASWVMGMGRFERQRWKTTYEELFGSHMLIHNIRNIQKIVVSEEGDGAFAVVDVDTLWRNINTNMNYHWKGRACKIYTKVKEERGYVWKLISHTGLLNYPSLHLEYIS
jgi:ketosteroid isomerase-like protein